MKTKKCRPVLVENRFNSLEEMNGDIIIRNGILYTHTTIPSLKKYETDRVFELILISLEDENIEVGDLVCDTLKNRLFNAMSNYDGMKYIHKVIATQDQLSPEYIAKFVEQYNNWKVEYVTIEWQTDWDKRTVACMEGYLDDPSEFPYKPQPKLTNGFVTIVKKEPILYTEEEVLEKLIEYNEELWSSTRMFSNESLRYWFNQNKKK